MNRRVRRIVLLPLVVAICFGALLGLSLVVRAAFGLGVFAGPEAFIWLGIVLSAFCGVLVAELVPHQVRLKRFLIGAVVLTAFLVYSFAVRAFLTSESGTPEGFWWYVGLLAGACGLTVHFCMRSPTAPPPNTSLEQTRD